MEFESDYVGKCSCQFDSNDIDGCSCLSTISLDKKNIDPSAVNLYDRKADAIQDINLVKGLNLFSEDLYPCHGAKRFILAKRRVIWNKIKQQKSYYYENIEGEQQVKLHIDIDSYNGRDISHHDKIMLLKMKCESIIKTINIKLMEDHEILKPEIIVLRSKLWRDKLSAHIIYNNVCTKSILHQKKFFIDLENDLDEDFDPRIYRVGCFRMYGCQKKGKDNKLRYFFSVNYDRSNDREALFMDTLVTNIGEGCKEVEIDISDMIKCPKTRVYRDKDGNVIPKNHLRKENLQKLKAIIDLIKIKRVRDYWDWLKVGMCLHNINPDSFDLWDEWSKRYEKKYNKYTCRMKWNSFRLGKLGIATLIYYAKKDNPKDFKNLASYFGDKQMFVNYKEICRDYLIEKEDELTEINKEDLADNEKVINGLMNWSGGKQKKIFAIRSAYGTGKTTLIEKIIKKFGFKRILWVSYRQTYTADIMGKFQELGFKSYMKRNFDADRIVCQVDSLTKLEGLEDIIPQYDLVILDEIESILNHYNSSTIKDKLNNFDCFKAILHNSGKILALDGDFYNRAYHFLSFFGEIDLYVNRCRPNRRNFIFCDHKEYFHTQMNWAIDKGENIVLLNLSSRVANNYKEYFDKKGGKCCIHTAKTDDEHKIFLENVNKYWINYQVVIYSPTVEAGVSFDEEHFHKIFCILSDESTSPRGFLQMISRVRKLKCSDIYIYNNGLPFKTKSHFYTFAEVREYFNEIGSKDKKRMIYKDDKDGLYKYKSDDVYDIMMAYNKQEELNKKRHYFIPYLIGLLEDKGHKYQYVPNISKRYKIDKKAKNLVKVLRGNRDKEDRKLNQTKVDLLNTPDISNAEYDIILGHQYKSKASEMDKLKIAKHNYKKHFGIGDITEEFIDTFYMKEHMLDNLAGVIDKRNISGYKQYIIKGEKDVEIKQQILRIDYIKDIVQLLGYDNIFDKKLIGRDNFKENIKKVLKDALLFKNPEISKPLFGLQNNAVLLYFNPEDDNLVERFIKSVNFILAGFGFTIVQDRGKATVDKKRVWINSYKIQIYGHIDDFLVAKKHNGRLYDEHGLLQDRVQYWNKLICPDDDSDVGFDD